LNIRSIDGGYLANFAAGRIGRRTSSPPQLGHTPRNISFAQVTQNVHSNEQIIARVESGGKSTSQHSQPGLSDNINFAPMH
jgi:hypothetical protein